MYACNRQPINLSRRDWYGDCLELAPYEEAPYKVLISPVNSY
jgi:hypothetical protein